VGQLYVAEEARLHELDQGRFSLQVVGQSSTCACCVFMSPGVRVRTGSPQKHAGGMHGLKPLATSRKGGLLMKSLKDVFEGHGEREQHRVHAYHHDATA
jgi:hypothetical protein